MLARQRRVLERAAADLDSAAVRWGKFGEARIALAQLLAERNGVRIRTLVVDEGFGTQDKQGIQNLIEAIQSIREDFSKILVITHLDEMKEAFPVRIEVQKHPGIGSTYEILGV